MEIKRSPHGSIEAKHLFYLNEMKRIDKENNELLIRKERIEKELGKVNKQLNIGRQLREKYRNLVSRMKQIRKAKNRFENNGIS